MASQATQRPWQAIIFVQRRMAAQALWKLLSSCPSLDFLKCQVLMGLGGALQSVTHSTKVIKCGKRWQILISQCNEHGHGLM